MAKSISLSEPTIDIYPLGTTYRRMGYSICHRGNQLIKGAVFQTAEKKRWIEELSKKVEEMTA
jgi:hypothetical protein